MTDHPAYRSVAHGVLVRADVPDSPLLRLQVARRADRRRRRGRVCHVDAATDVVVVRGVRVSSLGRLFTEMADRLPLVELVVLGDWMVRRRGVEPARLRAAAARVAGDRGRRAREAAAYVRFKVDSPMETRLRMLLVLAGIPEPEVNLEIRAEDGELLRRFDLSWPQVRVIVEYAGRVHIETDEQWEKDLARREVTDDEGWRNFPGRG